MITHYLPLIVAIIGLLLYLFVGVNAPAPGTPVTPAVSANRVAEIGRLMFWVGLLAYLLTVK